MNEFIEWLSSYLGIDKNPTATIIVSLAVFCLGVIVNELVKAISRFRERRAIRELVRRNYLIFKKYLHDQSSSLSTFGSFITLKGSPPNFNLYVKLCSALDNFREISYSSAFKAFFVGFENFRLKGRVKRIQAFDNLYNSLSVVKGEQERMFPILLGFHKEDATMSSAVNLSMKEAFEAATDVSVTVNEKHGDRDHQSWLKERDGLFQTFSKGNPNDLMEVKKFLISILDFDMANGKPIATIFNAKQFWYYQLKLHTAIEDIKRLEMLVKTTSSYCRGIWEKFELTAKDLETYYWALFNRKLV
ncbi:hypothetical protein [Pedobacter miscanthi]|uniref:Uncharacterized protein n=1 Tax=Pedobacter miscanthi TaxID=2259170 RepID=A0A366LCB7_9SPHI|nr:hypothetical protein [Pedobacter miscanthi]RBQ11547.1 hypothetical protein DRW42_03540 [Pedobacter miscanthi]